MKEINDAWEDLIDSIQNEQATSSYIELDKDKEIEYMRKSRYRFQKIYSAIPRSSESLRVLDIGTTPFTFFIKKTLPHYEVATIDRTNLMEDNCQTWGIQFKSCDLDKPSIPFEDGYFDVIIFTEVLEHIFAPPTQILRELRRILADGGKLIISVPNIANLRNRIKFLFGKSPLAHPDDQLKSNWVHGHGHIREYTQQEIISLLNACDFTIDKTEFLLPPVPWDCIHPSHAGIIRSIIRVLHRAALSLYPPFRPVICVECRKLGTRAWAFTQEETKR